jgi:cell division septation protein DedD
MRTIAVVAVLLLGVSLALPELEPLAAVPPVQTVKPPPVPGTVTPSGQPATSSQAATAAAPKAVSAPIPTPAQAASTPPESLDNVCSTLLTSAQNNDLPVPFFANLIWQESRMRDNALSPKGAMGIAQFMPKVAAKSGVSNPFDPSQALPASAKLLHQLNDQFGNLGYAAAAYNAGAERVLDWLDHGRSLPRETRDYVMDITGRSIEAWRQKPEDNADLRFALQLPCRSLPAYAELAQAQTQHAQQERNQIEEARAQVTPSQQKAQAQTPAAGHPQEVAKTTTIAQREKTAEREQPRIKREASAHIRYGLREREHRRA